MLKKSILIMTIGLAAGCSSVSSYDKIADNVSYTYDHKLKQSVIKGPSDTNKTQGAKVKDFNYDLTIKDLDTHVNVSFNYKDSSPRNYNHVVDSGGQKYNFSRHENKILDCGVQGTFNEGKCIFTESFTFKMPRENRSQFAVIGTTGKNVYFEINKNYMSVMNDFVYKLKTPRSDYDESKIKKESLLTAKPVPVEKPNAIMPKPVKKVVVAEKIIEKEVKKEVKPVVIVEKAKPVEPTVIISKQVTPKTLILNEKPALLKKVVKKESKSPVVKKTPVLTPIDICSCIKFKNSCAEVTSCREAYDQLACGNKKLAPKKDGMPCPNVCKI